MSESPQTVIEILDLVNVPPFDPNIWIGQNRKYPDNPTEVPLGLLNHCRERVRIPDECQEWTDPKPDTSIHDLINLKLPQISNSLVSLKATNCFSNLPPNENVTVLQTRQLPPTPLIHQLNKHVHQAILDGRKSVEDPAFPSSRLPLWAISFWNDTLKLKGIQARCSDSLDWVRKHKAVKGHVNGGENIEEMLLSLPWNENVDIPGAASNTKSSIFTDLVSGRRINDVLMDMMFNHLSERCEDKPKIAESVVFETRRFMNDISLAKKDTDHNQPLTSFLKRLETRIRGSEITSLLFPVFLEKQEHWLVMEIDFHNCTISYGDSLGHRGMQAPKEALMKIQWWLSKRFHGKFTEKGNTLVHGKQSDSTECGIITANTAAHRVFGDRLWTSSNKASERLAWFSTLTNAHEENVGRKKSTTNQLIQTLHHASSTPRATSISFLLNPISGPSATDAPVGSEKEELPSTSTVVDNNVQLEAARGRPRSGTEASKEEKEPPNKRRRIEVVEENNQMVVYEVGSESVTLSDDQKGVTVSSVDADSNVCTLGKSKSAVWQRAQQAKHATQQSFSNEAARLATFKSSLEKIDDRVEVTNPWFVRHVLCDKSLKMKAPFNTWYYKQHVLKCKGSHLPGAGMRTISSMFADARTQSTPSVSKPPCSSAVNPDQRKAPCPGLSMKDHPSIEAYLERTGAMGGGGSSVTVIARELFRKKYSKLSIGRKRAVKIAQRNEWAWRNNHNMGTIQATACLGFAATTHDGKVSACSSCLLILKNKRFKVILRVRQPADKNYKYINYEFQNKGLGLIFSKSLDLRPLLEDDVKNSPMVKYVKGVLSGRYRANDFFGNLLQAVVLKRDREERGKGMQNMTYAHDLVEFSHIILTHSPAAYRVMREFLPMPDPRNLKLHSSRIPLFTLGISEKTFADVLGHLKALSYTGPVALSCDDTKLLASLRPYYDAQKKGFYITGHIGSEPYRIADIEAFAEVVKQGSLEKATKLRLWCLQVPIPQVTTIIVAALGIKENASADQLFPYLWDLVAGLMEQGVHVAGYITDGSNVERSIQEKLESKATRRESTRIPHPAGSSLDDIVVEIGFLENRAFATIQDTKHLSKTLRNNAITGARTLTFPNYTVGYGQIWEMAMSRTSPLYTRDVEKLDRQDDNAATRIFCADTLQWIHNHRPDQQGLAVYLFIFGELTDAYQNRSITINERVLMVLRAYFFLELWENFLAASGYAKSRHFISPQCRQICRIAIHGFLKLVIIYRDHLKYLDHPIPLFPWMYSTEVIEHIFGICRQFVKDFTAENFQRMVPKIHIQLRKSLLSSRINEGRAQASGYSHTYADVRGVNAQALAIFPSNKQMAATARQAYEEADSLFSLLGVSASDIHSLSPAQLPGIRSWWKEPNPEPNRDDDDSDYEVSDTESEPEDDIINTQAAIDRAECIDPETREEETALNSLRFASMAMSIEDDRIIQAMPEYDEEAAEEAISDDVDHIAHILADSLPAANGGGSSNPFAGAQFASNLVDFTPLIELRRTHQTKQAASGTRRVQSTANNQVEPIPEPSTVQDGAVKTSQEKTPGERKQIFARLNEILDRHKEAPGVGTGLDRTVRWQSRSTKGKGPDVECEPAGNAANAAAVAALGADALLKRRIEAARKHSIPSIVGSAGVSHVNALSSSEKNAATGYGFVLVDGEVMLAQVLAIYSKSSGKGARHAYKLEVPKITAASYISVQLYQHMTSTLFRRERGGQAFHTNRFAHLPSSAFLCLLENPPQPTPQGIRLVSASWESYKVLKSQVAVLKRFVKDLEKKKGKGGTVEEEEVTDDE